MSAKLLYSLSDDNPAVRKHIGCMTGFFHLFGRQHFLPGRRISGHHRKLPAGGRGNLDAEENEASHNSTVKKPKSVPEKQRASTDSSITSVSSSCGSSSLSSLEVNRTTNQKSERSSFRQHGSAEMQPQNTRHSGRRSLEIPNAVKDSILYRDARGISVKVATKGESTTLTYIDSPRPSHLSPKSAKPKISGLREPLGAIPTFRRVKTTTTPELQVERARSLQHKDSPRFSYDGRESRDSFKSNMKIKELPRYSLDSKRPTQNDLTGPCHSSQELGSHRRQSSVVAKLMGLEDLEELDITSSVEACDPFSRSSRSNTESKPVAVSGSPRSSRKEVNSAQGRSNPNPRIPVELAPWKRTEGNQGHTSNVNASTCSPSVYGEIEKRLAQLEFKKSGKDLRALKQILQAMQNSKKNCDSMKENESSYDRGLEQSPNLVTPRSIQCSTPSSPTIKNANSLKNSRSSIVVMKPAKTTEAVKNPASVVLPVPGLRKLEMVDRTRKSSEEQRTGRYGDTLKQTAGKVNQHSLENRSPGRVSGTVSPRLQKKKLSPSDSPKRTNQSGRQANHSVSPLRTHLSRSRNLQFSCDQGSEISGDSRDLSEQNNSMSLQSDGDASINSQEEMEVTSAYRPAGKKMASRLREDDFISKPLTCTTEQPSPVSVLDAANYGDESPSPVKMISHAFEDVEELRTSETQWNQMELKRPSVRNDSSPTTEVAQISKDTNPDHGYISEILFASGLLRDIDSGSMNLQLHKSGHLITRNLFLALEQMKHSSKLSNAIQSKSDEKLERRLIFDVVNEILVQNIVSNRSKHWLSSNRLEGRKIQQQQLLKGLCSEIDQLRCSFNEDDDDCFRNMLEKDLSHQSTVWTDGFNDISGIVLDIERMIFRDLISELVSSEATAIRARPASHRRQLFQN